MLITAHIARASYSVAREIDSVWVTALHWDARSGRTIGFIEGIKGDLPELKFLIESCSRFLGHPLMVPEIILHMVTTSLNEGARIPREEDFYPQERLTGLSYLPYFSEISHNEIWKWDFKNFQQATAIANKSYNTMAFLKRRFRFNAEYAQKMLEVLNELQGSRYTNMEIEKLIKNDNEWKQRLSDRIYQSETYEHQNQCVQERIQNLNTVVSIQYPFVEHY